MSWMKQSNFISFRIPLIVCLLTCGLLYCFSYLIEHTFEKISIQQNVSELNSVITSIERELTYYSPDENRDEFFQNLLLILTGHHHLFVYIIDDSGKIVYRTRGPNLSIALSQEDFERLITENSTAIWNIDKSSYRIGASRVLLDEGRQYTTIVAVARNLQLEFINRLRNGLGLLIAISCVLALIGSLISIYYTQKPINRLIKKIERINMKSLNYRISTASVPVKYVSLVKAFNDMLHRMEDVFERQRNFTADIAHEMRTPITNLTTQTQIVLNNARSTEEYREILYSNLEEYEKMSQMISDMLFLAQADNHQLVPNLIDIDLHSMISLMCEYFEPLTDEKNITFELEGNCSHIQGDKMMLGRAISNIISNAIRYTPENQTIKIKLGQLTQKRIQIIISNPGKKIESRHLPHLFDRFYRVDESRHRNNKDSSGTGIGLAIVKSIIDTHKGHIYVESDDLSTRFIINLPTVI
ncbi:heavy metal sensor histidine kinase [Gilliamella sp. ESL0443]|uniref:heavy metal sensor histidine kinase n=1 Tax=Gilliamella sp. ESL0443 TaxID=2704655 RepID=UPI001C69C114|nr:heavy metal sensor histidine kinase [Gilliamella sp. ESL0443]QYN42254.1 heavy metal sensor histidine kinase [Gilliamella sp. ESL0443]